MSNSYAGNTDRANTLIVKICNTMCNTCFMLLKSVREVRRKIYVGVAFEDFSFTKYTGIVMSDLL